MKSHIGERWRWNKVTEKMEQIFDDAPPKEVEAPFFHPDEIPPTESMATGDREFFTSKSRLRQHYKEHGYREVGNYKDMDKDQPKSKEERRQEIRESIQKAMNDRKYGMAPMTEKEKQQYKEEARRWK